MRKREEIVGDINSLENVPVSNYIILEILLDIRDILEDIKNE